MHGKEMAVFIPKLSSVHLSEYSQFILELKSTIFIVSGLKKLYSPVFLSLNTRQNSMLNFFLF